MKVTKWAMLIAMAGGLSATPVFAQTVLRQPSTVMRTGFEYGSYYQASAEQPAVSLAMLLSKLLRRCCCPWLHSSRLHREHWTNLCSPAACATDPSCGCATTCTSCQDCCTRMS